VCRACGCYSPQRRRDAEISAEKTRARFRV
jgi:hypothetical protein